MVEYAAAGRLCGSGVDMVGLDMMSAGCKAVTKTADLRVAGSASRDAPMCATRRMGLRTALYPGLRGEQRRGAKGSPIDEDGRDEVPYISWHHFHVLAFAIAFRYYIFTDDHVVTTRLLQSTRSMYDEIIGNRRVSQKIVWPLQ